VSVKDLCLATEGEGEKEKGNRSREMRTFLSLLHFLLFLFKNPLVLLLLQLQEIVISTSQHSDESVALDQYQFATSISKSHHFKNQNEFIQAKTIRNCPNGLQDGNYIFRKTSEEAWSFCGLSGTGFYEFQMGSQDLLAPQMEPEPTQFNNPFVVSISPDGLFALVAENGNHVIRQIILSTASVSTLAGVAGSAGATNGIGTNSQESSRTLYLSRWTLCFG
jgi:hypothetical protein